MFKRALTKHHSLEKIIDYQHNKCINILSRYYLNLVGFLFFMWLPRFLHIVCEVSFQCVIARGCSHIVELDWHRSPLFLLPFCMLSPMQFKSHQIVQVIEWSSFDLHQGQNKTQTCPNHSSLQMCVHLNHQTRRLHQMDLHLQIENKKGENEPKQEKIQSKQLKSKKTSKKKTKSRKSKAK